MAYLKRKVVLAVLSVVIGLAVALVMLGIVFPDIQLWHYLLPGYLLGIDADLFRPDAFRQHRLRFRRRRFWADDCDIHSVLHPRRRRSHG